MFWFDICFNQLVNINYKGLRLMRYKLITLISCLLFSVFANASLISLSEQQEITETGQSFSFSFDSLPMSDGDTGLLGITLSGDYSPRNPPPLAEGATLSIDGEVGILELFNLSSSPAIFSNSIVGLSLVDSALAGGGNFVTLEYLFEISESLLTSMVSDSSLLINIQNTSDVNFNPNDDGFVRVDFSYNSGNPVVDASAPATVSLVLVGLIAMAMRRRAFA